jgi:hypothetical protein
MFFGREHRYPVEYEVVPYVTRDSTGRPVYRAFAVPRRYESRTTGVGVSIR